MSVKKGDEQRIEGEGEGGGGMVRTKAGRKPPPSPRLHSHVFNLSCFVAASQLLWAVKNEKRVFHPFGLVPIFFFFLFFIMFRFELFQTKLFFFCIFFLFFYVFFFYRFNFFMNFQISHKTLPTAKQSANKIIK